MRTMQIATMTNSTTTFSQAALKRGNCDSYIDLPLDIGMVHRWKPHPSVYLYAAKQLGCEPHEVRPLPRALQSSYACM